MADERQRWRLSAACRGQETDIWYPERGEDHRVPRAICATCPVIVDCLEHALTWPETMGVWGGRTVQERRRLRRGRGLTIRSPRMVPVVAAPSVSVRFLSSAPTVPSVDDPACPTTIPAAGSSDVAGVRRTSIGATG